MKSYERRTIICYIFCDWLMALIAWGVFFTFRKWSIGLEWTQAMAAATADSNFWTGIAVLPLAWLLLYALVGAYRHVLRKSRLRELGQTLLTTTIGCVAIFFVFLIDDAVPYSFFIYNEFIILFVIHFTLTYLPRLFLTSRTVHQVHNRQLGFPTLMIGSGPSACKTYADLDHQEVFSGNAFVGYIDVGDGACADMGRILPRLGDLSSLKDIVHSHQVEEVVVALEDNEQQHMRMVLLTLGGCGDIIIKLTPNSRDIMVGNIKINNIFHSPLLTIDNRLMPDWQYSVKRIFDVSVSLLVMVVLSPVYLLTAIAVKCSSPGPVFYAQERIGYGGKAFKMIKFRSMYVNAEAGGPALASDDDPRITPFGRFMRKTRLDEIPQFYNVLKGNMSIVGPRPERQYYIDQIVQRAPEYMLLQRIRPGITSWGQVKYGYASSVDEMVERLRYDLYYLDNMTIATDIKILIHTAIIICQGRGK